MDWTNLINNVKFNFKGGGGGVSLDHAGPPAWIYVGKYRTSTLISMHALLTKTIGLVVYCRHFLISIILSLGSKHGHGVWTVKT